MQCFWAFVIALCVRLCAGQHRQVTMSDLSHLCSDSLEGELVAHPLDCSAYFSCARIPTLLYCQEGLHFDADRRECDVPEKANCKPLQPVSTTTDINWWHNKPRPVFMAVDVVSGLAVNPMEKYDPQQVECRHFGAYFLPHPSKCQLYFICAYGHLHRHQCGRGTLWNYKTSECQLSGEALCYNDTQSLQSPHTGGNQLTTVCYIVQTGTLATSESSSKGTESTATSSTTTAVIPPRAEPSALTCPSERQSYLSHPEDCSKYYICIVGKPVLTSCPQGLYWDQKSGYCDLAKNVKCFQN